jgi:adenosylhomocysteinase
LNENQVTKNSLIESGTKSWEWASSRMGVVNNILNEYGSKLPLKDIKIGLCLHITKETAVLALALNRLGGNISICSANPLSVQDNIAAFLESKGVKVFAHRGETKKEYHNYIEKVLDTLPQIIVDDGSVMHAMAHLRGRVNIKGGTEETTSGIRRLKNLELDHKLKYPVIGVDCAKTKRLFDNRYGTGQSTLDAIIRITDLLIAGKKIAVCGYGPVGRGVSERARGLGAIVTVTETDAIRALQAHMDGFDVKQLSEISKDGDIFITCTGQTHVIRKEHIIKMKSGSILANAGHFDTEIDIKYLMSNCKERDLVRPYLECFHIHRKKIYLLSSGRVVNLIGSQGNAPDVMAMSFANQLLSIIYINKNYDKLKKKLYSVPLQIDEHVAKTALKCFRVKIDKLTNRQLKYEGSFN